MPLSIRTADEKFGGASRRVLQLSRRANRIVAQLAEFRFRMVQLFADRSHIILRCAPDSQ